MRPGIGAGITFVHGRMLRTPHGNESAETFMIRATRTRAGDRIRLEGADGIRQLTARMPTGVGVATAFDTEARPWGMTCTSLATVANDPPTILVCLRSGSPSLDAVLTAGEFALNILPREARVAAELFASEAPDVFDRVDWTVPRGATGPHLRTDAHTVANCAVVGHASHGDQVVVFARVCEVLLKPTVPTLRCGLWR